MESVVIGFEFVAIGGDEVFVDYRRPARAARNDEFIEFSACLFEQLVIRITSLAYRYSIPHTVQ